MKPPGPKWFGEAVAVETCTGQGSYAPVLSAPVTLKSNTSQTDTLTRSASGDTLVSTRVFRFHPNDEAAVTHNSRITYDGLASIVTKLRKYREFGRLIYIEATTT